MSHKKSKKSFARKPIIRKIKPTTKRLNQTSENKSSSNTPLIFSSSAESKSRFWNTFIHAVEAEPVDIKTIRGATGLVHPAVAVGVDAGRKRLIIISGDPDGRSAALAQADIQHEYKDYKVISARPIAVNLAKTAESLAGIFGKSEFRYGDLDHLSKSAERNKRLMESRIKQLLDIGLTSSIRAIGYAALNASSTWQDVIKQLSNVQFATVSDQLATSGEDRMSKSDSPVINFGLLAAFDPAETDRQMGICSVPLYEFSSTDAETFQSGVDIEAARQILKARDILQYFFPAPDVLALSLIEKKSVSFADLIDLLKRPADIGHPLGNSELIPSNLTLDELVDTLSAQGYTVEGELGLELTESGKASRMSVKFKPREGFLSKLSNLISVKIDLNLKDIFKP